MPDESRFDRVNDLLADPSFTSLVDQSVRDYISWDELLAERPLPVGLSAKQTWILLSEIRRFGAVVFPIPSLTGDYFWYHITGEGSACLETIQRECGPDSLLHRTLLEREGHRFLLQSRLRETIATCELDGIRVNRANARAVLEGRSPRTPADRLLMNSYEMLKELDSLVSERFTPELVRHLYERAAHGVDLRGLKRGVPRTDLGNDRRPDDMPLTPELKARVLERLCDVANGEAGDSTAPVPAQAYNILSSMSYWQPMPDLNHTISLYLQRLFAVKRHYPVLGYLPTSNFVARWFSKDLAPGVVRFPEIKRVPLPGWIDGTEDILTYLQLIVAAIGELKGSVLAAQEENAALETALHRIDLNYRQRAVLAQALGHPTAEFRIRQQMTLHRVVYQTARTDLLELVDRRFLTKRVCGQTFVFVPAEDLASRLRQQTKARGVTP
jgi:Fic family protein